MLDPRIIAPAFLSSLLLLTGCSSEALDEDDEAPPATVEIESVSLTRVYEPDTTVPVSATSLAFNPTVDGELWVALRQFASGLPCTKDDDSGCNALPGAMAVVSDAISAKPSAVVKQDGNAWHFMRRPTAMSWGDGELFASCGEAYTDNYEDDGIAYAGPVLWSSSPEIFGVEPRPDQNGTHLDMLHETPYCMGIAHESDNIYWVFNGDAGALDRVDFHTPHQIGGEDHSDGEVHRYVTGQLSRVPEVPSHLVYDAARARLYAVDTGHSRVISVDPSTATPGGKIAILEVLQASGEMDGATVSELVPPGRLQTPSGIALAGSSIYVTDNATSMIHVFDTSGAPLRVLDTALPAGSLAGITIGPDDKPYITDLHTGNVERVEVSP